MMKSMPSPSTSAVTFTTGFCLVAVTVVAALLAAAAPSRAAGSPEQVETQLGGRPTVIELHHPSRPARGAVVLAHGFTRTRATMAGHAAALADAGVLAVAPDLPYYTDSRRNAHALADLVGHLQEGRWAPPVRRVVLVGFSAGGLAALLAAGTPGVVGYVGLDAFDRPGGVGLQAARSLQTPVRLLRAEASLCNAYGISEPWARALPNLVEDRVLAGASHCDFESPTDALCRWVCGDVDPARQQVVRQTLLDAVRDWLPDDATAAQTVAAPALQ
jgi:pimeloyl-ACP methyl ester carboxylesterase